MLNNAKNWANSHSPEILTGLSCIGIVATTILSFRAGLKSSKIIEKKKKQYKKIDKSNKDEVVKFVAGSAKELAPYVLPAVGVGIATMACGIKSTTINSSRVATLASVAGMAAKEVGSINEELSETFGDKKSKKIRSNAAQRRLNKSTIKNEDLLYIDMIGGDIYCSIPFFNVDFVSTHEDVNRAIENLAFKCDHENGVTATDLLNLLGYHDTVDASDCIYWSPSDLVLVEDRFGDKVPTLPIETTTIMRREKPCLAIVFKEFNVKKY